MSKVYDLQKLIGGVRADRPLAEIPTRVITSTLLSGTILRIDSLLDLQTKTKGAGWQKLHGWTRRISDDAMTYALERYHLEDLRVVHCGVMRKLKSNEQLEECRINGLLFVPLDANEQFCSRSRCCDQCSHRRVKVKNSASQEEDVTEYFHRHV